MESARIQQLLEKYWKCESTLEEEQELKQLLASTDEHAFTHEKALFGYFADSKSIHLEGNIEVPETSDSKTESKVVQMSPEPKKGVSNVNWLQWAAILAGIGVASFIFTQMGGSKDDSKMISTAHLEDTYQDPEQALEETKKALAFIAEKLNSGKKQVGKIKALHDAQNELRADKPDESGSANVN